MLSLYCLVRLKVRRKWYLDGIKMAFTSTQQRRQGAYETHIWHFTTTFKVLQIHFVCSIWHNWIVAVDWYFQIQFSPVCMRVCSLLSELCVWRILPARAHDYRCHASGFFRRKLLFHSNINFPHLFSSFPKTYIKCIVRHSLRCESEIHSSPTTIRSSQTFSISIHFPPVYFQLSPCTPRAKKAGYCFISVVVSRIYSANTQRVRAYPIINATNFNSTFKDTITIQTIQRSNIHWNIHWNILFSFGFFPVYQTQFSVL